MEDLTDRYGPPEFITIIPICSVCKHFDLDKELCKKNVENFIRYKYAKQYDCKKAEIDKNSPRYNWWVDQEKKKKNEQ